jgi:hypothetical protein
VVLGRVASSSWTVLRRVAIFAKCFLQTVNLYVGGGKLWGSRGTVAKKLTSKSGWRGVSVGTGIGVGRGERSGSRRVNSSPFLLSCLLSTDRLHLQDLFTRNSCLRSPVSSPPPLPQPAPLRPQTHLYQSPLAHLTAAPPLAHPACSTSP